MTFLRKIKSFIVLPLFLLLFSCNSQEVKKIDLIGNWQIMSNSENPDFMYMEIYIDENEIITNNEESGLKPSEIYFLEKNILSVKRWTTDKILRIGELELNDNIMTISKENHELVYMKLKNDSNMLGDLIENKISQSEFDSAFYKRMEKWKIVNSRSR